MKATIYKIYPSLMTNGKYGYTLTKPENDTDTIYEEHVYDLPNGYFVAHNTSGQLMIFDLHGDGCVLIGDETGKVITLMSTGYVGKIYEE